MLAVSLQDGADHHFLYPSARC